MFNILRELNESNSSNFKITILKKYEDNTKLKRVLMMTYDKVKFTYGMSLKSLKKFKQTNKNYYTLGDALNFIEEEICTRNITGNAAKQAMVNMINSLEKTDGQIIEMIINRDIKCNIGRTQINKVWKNLISKPVYMRCGVYNKKTSKKINFPALIQLKADGTYREFSVCDGTVECRSRSGESYEYPIHFEELKLLSNGVYIGELTVAGVTDRAIGNGMINSDNPPHEDIILELWDYVTFEEYSNAGEKVKNITPYLMRFDSLNLELLKIAPNFIRTIPSITVNNLSSALQQTTEWMNDGYEGGVLKNFGAVFRDGTSPEQLKLKLEIDAEMRVVGFQDGKIGSKREGKVGSLIFENDECTIKGKCSGFTDKELEDMCSNPDNYLGKVITVQFNDITKGTGNSYYALSHPRFIEVRTDKDETDSLEKVQELREMAMEIV